MMKKILNKILKFFKMIFRGIYKCIDIIIITPLSKTAYFFTDRFSTKGGKFDKFINNPNTLIYISLICAFAAFFAIDKKVINLVETEATVLSSQEVVAEYNSEAYVVEGIPKTADIVLMGRKRDL